MKIMMSAGEASGDMHAAAVAVEIKREYPGAEIFGMGGDNMRNAGVRIIYDIGNLGNYRSGRSHSSFITVF